MARCPAVVHLTGKLTLLPRLISGKLSVEDLDIQFPPNMQQDEAPAPAEENALPEARHA